MKHSTHTQAHLDASRAAWEAVEQLARRANPEAEQCAAL